MIVRSRLDRPTWTGRLDYPFTTQTPVISRSMPGSPLRPRVPRNPAFAGRPLRNRRRTVCLPCRRSRVRIPSAASEDLRFAGLFRWTSRVVRLRRVGLIPDSRARRASGGFKKPRLAGNSGRFEPKSVCRLPRTSNPLPAATVSRLFLQPRVLACGRVPGRIPPIRLCGASPVSVRKPRGNLGPPRRAIADCHVRCEVRARRRGTLVLDLVPAPCAITQGRARAAPDSRGIELLAEFGLPQLAQLPPLCRGRVQAALIQRLLARPRRRHSTCVTGTCSRAP